MWNVEKSGFFVEGEVKERFLRLCSKIWVRIIINIFFVLSFGWREGILLCVYDVSNFFFMIRYNNVW